MRGKNLFLFGIILLVSVLAISGVLAACTDTDGGENLFKKGEIIFNGQTFVDYCSSDSQVVEGYCDNGRLKLVDSTDSGSSSGTFCSNGCVDGACVGDGEIYPNFCPEWEAGNCASGMCGWFEEGDTIWAHAKCIGDSPDDDPDDYLGFGACDWGRGWWVYNGVAAERNEQQDDELNESMPEKLATKICCDGIVYNGDVCPLVSSCNDGVCDDGEDFNSCPEDCDRVSSKTFTIECDDFPTGDISGDVIVKYRRPGSALYLQSTGSIEGQRNAVSIDSFFINAPFVAVSSGMGADNIQLEMKNLGGEHLTDVTVNVVDLNIGGSCTETVSVDFPTEDDDTCTDSDSFDHYVKGRVTGWTGSGQLVTKIDHCLVSGVPEEDVGKLGEYYCCGNGGICLEDFECPNGCYDGVCVAEECERVENFMISPTNLTIGYDEWTLGNSDSYISDYSEDRSYYADFYKQTEWGYDSAYISLRVIDPNYYYTIEERMANMLERGLCQQRKIYFETEETITGEYNEEYQVVYVCQDLWKIANDQKNVNNPYWNDRNSVETIWFNGDMLFRVSSYSTNYNGNCFDYESCQDREEEAHRRQQGDIAEVLGDLLDNQAEYPGGFYLDWDVEQVIKYLLEDCDSGVEESVGYQGSWQCKLEPAVCPPHGYQEEICEKYNYNSEDRDDRYDTRKTQIQCNPGLCSGCYVPRWFGGSELDSKCIPYGFRFEQNSGDFELVTKTHTYGGYEEDSDKLSVGDYESEVFMEISSDNTMLFRVSSWDNVTYNLSIGDELDLLEILNYELYDNGEILQYLFKIDNIYYDSENYEDSYFEYTVVMESPETEHIYTWEEPIMFNMYCDMDGRVKQQKVPGWNGEWANCQNNYECASNLCSSGECIELTQMIADASLMKRTGVRLWCTFARMSPDITYDSCIFDLLGEEVDEAVPVGGSSGSGGSSSN